MNSMTDKSDQKNMNKARYEIRDWDDENILLDTRLLRGIYAYGFEKPSAIQQRAVKPILMGRDVIAQAQSGKFELSLNPV